MLGIFLDTETNGLNPHKHKILEIAYKILDVKTGDLKHSFESIIAQPQEEWKKSDPESLKITGFTWEEVCQGKKIDHIARLIVMTFNEWNIKQKEAIFICQNPSFDRAFFSQIVDPDLQESLKWPYHWLDLASMFWAENVQKGKSHLASYPWETGVSKDIISAAYQLPPEVKPHRAMNGVDHLLLCYEAVVGFPEKTQLPCEKK